MSSAHHNHTYGQVLCSYFHRLHNEVFHQFVVVVCLHHLAQWQQVTPSRLLVDRFLQHLYLKEIFVCRALLALSLYDASLYFFASLLLGGSIFDVAGLLGPPSSSTVTGLLGSFLTLLLASPLGPVLSVVVSSLGLASSLLGIFDFVGSVFLLNTSSLHGEGLYLYMYGSGFSRFRTTDRSSAYSSSCSFHTMALEHLLCRL